MINNIQRAVKALLYAKGKYLLLLKSKKEDIAPEEWDIPGGRVKQGEGLPQALAREIQEETGIAIDPFKASVIKTWTLEKKDFNLEGTDFLCVLNDVAEVVLSQEHTEAAWLSKNEIMASEKIPFWLKDTVKMANQP